MCSISCNTESTSLNYTNEKVPVSIAKNFTMTYTDSMLTKSFVSGKIHYDFTNDILNYSEFFEDVELVIYDENKTSTIRSEYAIVYNSKQVYTIVYSCMQFCAVIVQLSLQ